MSIYSVSSILTQAHLGAPNLSPKPKPECHKELADKKPRTTTNAEPCLTLHAILSNLFEGGFKFVLDGKTPSYTRQ